jgi:superfamily II DNA or RNA helicase
LENEDGTILVATYATMSTGVNIPKLHEVVLYANCKSKIKVLQSIGRGLRKHATKDKIMLYDVIDDLSYQTNRGRVVDNYLVKHFKERCAYYKEQEFPIVTMSLSI